MKNKMYMIYCNDTYITCFIDDKNFNHEVVQQGSDVVVTTLDYFYNYKNYNHFCNCHYTVKEV